MRTTFLIDGFNFYHSIDDSKFRNKYKWFNYKDYCAYFLSKNEILHEIYYFTAIAKWRKKESWQRHETFIAALRELGIKIVLGNFKEKSYKCPNKRSSTNVCLIQKNGGIKCSQKFKRHEEKQTDVNIELYICIAWPI